MLYVRIYLSYLAANEWVKAEGSGQTDVTAGSGHSGRAHALTAAGVA